MQISLSTESFLLKNVYSLPDGIEVMILEAIKTTISDFL